MTLFLAKTGGDWLPGHDPGVAKLRHGEVTDTIRAMTSDDGKMITMDAVSSPAFDFPDRAHYVGCILVLIDLESPKHSRISTRATVLDSNVAVTSTTALVAERTATHLYLLTNLRMWAGGRFADTLTDEFKEAQSTRGNIQVVVEQLGQSEETLEDVQRFTLRPEMCWRSSADDDYAIFKVAVPPEVDARHVFVIVLSDKRGDRG